MPRRSSIKTLPPEIKREVDLLLADGRHTLDDVVAHLQKLGAGVSRSAVGRYSMEFEEVAGRMREAREVAASFAKELGAIPDNDMGRALVEMLHHMIFKQMLAQSREEDGSVDTKDLMQLAKALKDAAGTNKLSVDLEMKIREDQRELVEAEMKKKLDAAAGGSGFNAEAAAEARRILGFVV